MLRYDFEQIGQDIELRELQVKETGLEQLKTLTKLFLLTDLDARIQSNHFPEFSKKIGDSGVYDWAFKPKTRVADERDAEIQNRENFMAMLTGNK